MDIFAPRPDLIASAAGRTKAEFGAIVDALASSPVMRAEAIAGGKTEFVNRISRATVGLAVDRHMIEDLFYFLTRLQAQTGVSAETYLDTVTPPPTPPTAEAIDRAWEWDSASSEEGRRFFHGSDRGPLTLNTDEPLQ